MTLPVGDQKPPQILLQKGDRWRDVTPKIPSIQEIKSQSDDSLENCMKEVNSALNNGQPIPEDILPLLIIPQHQNFYRKLLDQAVQEELQNSICEAEEKKTTPILRIHSAPSTEWIPWEILHDGEEFLGLRFQIARLPIASKGPVETNNQIHLLRNIHNLLGQKILKDEDKWRATFTDKVPGFVSVKLMPDGQQNYPTTREVRNAMVQGSADILHITCHGKITKENERYWTLHEEGEDFRYHINRTLLEGLLEVISTRLVFANACCPSADKSIKSPLSFGTILYEKGVLNFIGPIASISQGMAIEFACKFYEQLLKLDGSAGLPIGAALLNTKRMFEDQKDPSYLFYSLYGPPETTFQAV